MSKTIVTITMTNGYKHQIISQDNVETTMKIVSNAINHPSWLISDEAIINTKYITYIEFTKYKESEKSLAIVEPEYIEPEQMEDNDAVG